MVQYSGFGNAANQPYFVLQGFLTRDKGVEIESLDSLVKIKNIPDGQQDSFKRGFAEGFLKAQTLTQRSQGKFNIHRPALSHLNVFIMNH